MAVRPRTSSTLPTPSTDGTPPRGDVIGLPSTARVAFWSVIVVGVLVNLGIWAGIIARSAFEAPWKGYFIAFFSLDGELNVATAVSVLALGGCAVLLLALRSVRTRRGHGYGRYWASLAILFAYLAIDEGVGLHEQLTNPASNLPFTTGFLAWGWVVAGIPFAIVVGAINLRFVLHLPRSHALAVFIAGGAYVTGAVGCEMVGAKLAEDGGLWEFPYLVVVTLEETLEMAGIATFFVTLWSLLERHSPQFAWGTSAGG